MVQRRGAPAKEEMLPFSENLAGDVENLVKESKSMDMDSRYDSEDKAMRIKQWREGPFASRMAASWNEANARFMKRPGEECFNMSDDVDGMPCFCCSALVCSRIGAGRVGNMAVLKQTTEWVEEEEIDENGDSRIRRFTRPKLQIIVGPYWPMLFCVTYPLILGVSGLTLYTRIPYLPPLVGFVWFVLTVSLIVALAMTAFRDPGILPRHENPPNNDWRWSDRTYSYKPRKAYYDPDTGVVVEGFDHTCPWTGTAIGKKNYGAFCCFVALVFVCLILNIILLTGGAAGAIRNYH